MRIGGLQKCSLIDYPGRLSCVIFTQGCNFRCPYCHNRELVLPQHFKDPISPQEVLDHLNKRRAYLDAVVISGGEPTQQEDLIDFMGLVKGLDYLIKLDTNGSRPHVIQKIIRQGMADYIAMDVKTSLEKYPKAIGVDFSVEKIKESIELIKNSGIPHEFRTTVVQPFCTFEDVCQVSLLVKGSHSYRLQAFRESPNMINPNLQRVKQVPADEIGTWQEKIGTPGA